MSDNHVRDTRTTAPLPRSRPAGDDILPRDTGDTGAPEATSVPTPPAAPARPRTEYWDFTTASWRSRGPVVAPRESD